jgi:hypothetical protein
MIMKVQLAKKSELDVALVPAKVKPVVEVSKVKNLGQV